MMKKNLTRRKDGSYVLKHKTVKAKKGDCKDCGQNEKNRSLGLLYRFKAWDMTSVQDHMEQYLRDNHDTKSITPLWCGECKALIEYSVELDK
tara:strand:+ start:17 stop:292 length:276 start_codon:yes stop_codon:yes gene_type:complete